MNTKKLLGIIGATVLFIGGFMPFVSMPITGDMNYIHNASIEGTIVLVFSAISLVLAFAKKFKGLWFTGLGSLGIILFTVINHKLEMAQAKVEGLAQLESELGNNLFAEKVVDATIQFIHLRWGWVVLLAGAALVIASAAIREKK